MGGNNNGDDVPRRLSCHGITQNDSFTVYKVEKHPLFYEWFSNLSSKLPVDDDIGHDFHLYDVESDTVTFYGAEEEVTIIVGERTVMLLFQFQPDPDTMLSYLDMVEPD